MYAVTIRSGSQRMALEDTEPTSVDRRLSRSPLANAFRDRQSAPSRRSNTWAWISLFTRREIFVEMREVTLRSSRPTRAEATITVTMNHRWSLS